MQTNSNFIDLFSLVASYSVKNLHKTVHKLADLNRLYISDNSCRKIIEAIIDFSSIDTNTVPMEALCQKSGLPSSNELVKSIYSKNPDSISIGDFNASLVSLADVLCKETIEHITRTAKPKDLQLKINKALECLARVQNLGDKTKLYSISEVATEFNQELLKRASSDETVFGLKTGFRELDEGLNGIEQKKYYIVAGRPSMGKTAFSLCLANNISRLNNAHVLIFSKEMPRSEIYRRLLASGAEVDNKSLKTGCLSKSHQEKVSQYTDVLKSLRITIVDDYKLTVEDAYEIVEELATTNPVDLVIADYFQKFSTRMKPMLPNKTDQLEEISGVFKDMTSIAPVILLSQLNRTLEQRPDKRPVMSDLKGTSCLEQDADAIMFLYRDVVYDPNCENPDIAELNIPKVRDGESATINLKFEGRYVKFKETNKIVNENHTVTMSGTSSPL